MKRLRWLIADIQLIVKVFREPKVCPACRGARAIWMEDGVNYFQRQCVVCCGS